MTFTLRRTRNTQRWTKQKTTHRKIEHKFDGITYKAENRMIVYCLCELVFQCFQTFARVCFAKAYAMS